MDINFFISSTRAQFDLLDKPGRHTRIWTIYVMLNPRVRAYITRAGS